jgi:probable phosphoglycerate mutase
MPLVAYFVRHGESQANVDRVFANRIGYPAGLTDIGREQAGTLASLLADRAVTHVYASPLPRAVQTAQTIGRVLTVPVEVSDALREYDVGRSEGLPYGGTDAWRWEEHTRVERAWREGDRNARHPGGESLADIASRFLPFMTALAETHAPTDRLALVGHGGLYLAVLPELFGTVSLDEALGYGLHHCEIVTATYADGRWACLQWGDHRLG